MDFGGTDSKLSEEIRIPNHRFEIPGGNLKFPAAISIFGERFLKSGSRRYKSSPGFQIPVCDFEIPIRNIQNAGRHFKFPLADLKIACARVKNRIGNIMSSIRNSKSPTAI